MSRYQGTPLNEIRIRPNCGRAVIFIHGFSGNRDDTWDRLPGLLGTVVEDWDIYTLGYASTLRPDFLGVWSADPDLHIVATMLKTWVHMDPLRRYGSLALVAHSMGGLVVQRALLDDPGLADRTDKVTLFGTPSAGLRKASWTRFWKRQLRNMSKDSEFITSLRREWAARFEPEPAFDFKVVAGDSDNFVPPESSLGPFPRHSQFVVPGDHLSIVRAADAHSPSVRLLASALSDVPAEEQMTAPLTLATEIPDAGAEALIGDHGEKMSEQEVVRAALALERIGKRDQAMALLHRHETLGTDVQGTLAGRVKRIWIENEDIEFAQHALQLYRAALVKAIAKDDKSQVYYLSINVAFLEFVAFDRIKPAREMARLALENAIASEASAWSVATQAEANLYLGHRELALDLYKRMPDFGAEHWEYASTALQAGQIASKLRDREFAEGLEQIFTPST